MKKFNKKLSWVISLAVALSFAAVTSNEVGALEKKVNATTQTKIKKKLPTVTDDTTNLTTSDCKLLLNGTVVEVADGRCGASGKYCKSSAGSACITE